MDAELRAVLDQMPALDFTTNVQRARAELLSFFHSQPDHGPQPGVKLDDRQVPGRDSHPAVGIRIYRPAASGGRLPGLLWIHGGGFIVGHPIMDDDLCQRFAREAGCVVVSVDWRLAPEHPFPAGLEDAYTVLAWMAASREELGLDGRLAVAGASAGGNLAAGLALLARDRQGPALMFQMPLYGCFDDRHESRSSQRVRDPRVWNRDLSLKAWDWYLQGSDRRGLPGYAAPLRAEDLSGLPPAYLCVGDLDLLRDENIDYAVRLIRCGVPVEFHLYPGAFHGFDRMAPNTEISRRASAGYVDALARAFMTI